MAHFHANIDGKSNTPPVKNKDLFFFVILFTAIVGAPSYLDILQRVKDDFRLAPALQWIPERWSAVGSFVGGLVEPPVMRVFAWLNDAFNLSLTLHPHWFPLCAILMIWALAVFRMLIIDGKISKPPLQVYFANLVRAVFYIIGAFLAAIAGGMIDLEQGWATQAVTAGVVMIPLQILYGVGWAAQHLVLPKRYKNSSTRMKTPLRDGVRDAINAGITIAIITSVIYFIPYISSGASIVAISAYIFWRGIVYLWTWYTERDIFSFRLSITIFSGFITAGAILVSDALFKNWDNLIDFTERYWDFLIVFFER